jgi:hypothetical protein
MRKYALASAVLAAVAGAFGYVLRRSELSRAFEPDTGLPVAGAASTRALIFYTLFVLVAALAVSIVVRRRFFAAPTYRGAFAPSNATYLVFAGLICAALLASAFIVFTRARGTDIARGQTAVAALTAVSGLSIFGLAFEAYRGRDFKASLLYTVVPELFLTFWLLLLYRRNQTNPVRLQYVFQCLAVAASALAFYFTTSYVYGRPSPARVVFTHSAAIFLLAVASADPLPAEQRAVFLTLLVFFVVNLARLVQNLTPRYPRPPRHLKGRKPDDVEA